MMRVQRDPNLTHSRDWATARQTLLQLVQDDSHTQPKSPTDNSTDTTQNTADQRWENPDPTTTPLPVTAQAALRLEDVLPTTALEQLGLRALPDDFCLSVIIPVFNEARTIEQVIERLMSVPLPIELIIVDDGSQDGSRALLQDKVPQWQAQLRSDQSMQLLLHQGNQGKGAALKTGFQAAHGDVVTIQDADLEYDPFDLIWLIAPIVSDQADVVYGSRFAEGSQADSPFWHRWGNRLITLTSNLTTGLGWSDVETCYKVMRRSVVQRFLASLKERGFGIELEMTAKLARQTDIRFFERPIPYQKRGYAEGKKIGMKDALWAAWCILRYRLAD